MGSVDSVRDTLGRQRGGRWAEQQDYQVEEGNWKESSGLASNLLRDKTALYLKSWQATRYWRVASFPDSTSSN